MVSYAKAVRVIELAVKLGLNAYHFGSCGPAAVAINRVLFDGNATYVVATSKSAKAEGRRSGHVAVRVAGRLLDYEGKCDLNKMGMFVEGDSFEIVSEVREATVLRYFCRGNTLPVESAVLLLEQAKKLCDTSYEKKAIREHEKELAAMRREWLKAMEASRKKARRRRPKSARRRKGKAP